MYMKLCGPVSLQVLHAEPREHVSKVSKVLAVLGLARGGEC